MSGVAISLLTLRKGVLCSAFVPAITRAFAKVWLMIIDSDTCQRQRERKKEGDRERQWEEERERGRERGIKRETLWERGERDWHASTGWERDKMKNRRKNEANFGVKFRDVLRRGSVRGSGQS